MKIAVISYSGNVGKSTIARHLLLPRIPGASLIAIESTNAGADGAQVIRGHQFAALQEFLQLDGNVVVDVGASNIEDLLERMGQYRGSHEDFDAFVVPAVPQIKQQQDTIATLVELSRLGVPAHKIRVIFNLVKYPSELEETFAPLLQFLKQTRLAQFSLACHLEVNEIYARMRDMEVDMAALADDPVDYKAQIAATSDKAARMQLAGRLATQRLASGVLPMLDACFAALRLPADEDARFLAEA